MDDEEYPNPFEDEHPGDEPPREPVVYQHDRPVRSSAPTPSAWLPGNVLLPGLPDVRRLVSTSRPVFKSTVMTGNFEGSLGTMVNIPVTTEIETIVPTADAGPVALGYGAKSGTLVVFYRPRPEEDGQ